MNNTVWTFPSPLASYEQVVADKNLFMSTLVKLHSEMGTTLLIPQVRFEDLDLHKLFVEVTSRGGIEQVIREKKWSDVYATFKFPGAQPNASYRMREHYYSLLQDYEIIYFFKARGQFPPLIGFVYGKTERGYLVTFTMGSWKLEGVLYESTEKRVAQDTERQSYNVFPNTLTDKANPQELSKTKRTDQLKKINKQKEKEKEVVIDALTLQLWWPPQQNTETDAPMEESEEKEASSNACSEKYEDYCSDFELEQRSETHMERASDSMDTASVNGVLDGIFESGYFVTVTIGSEKLRGVLYPHQSPTLSILTQENLTENEKAVYKGKAVVDVRERCNREMEDHNSEELETRGQLIIDATPLRKSLEPY